MMSLNFQAEKHEKMLIERSKRRTVHLLLRSISIFSCFSAWKFKDIITQHS